MTCKQTFTKHLTQHGMFESQAQKVFEQYITKTSNNDQDSRWWDDPITDYPPSIHAIIIMAANREAMTWIDQELPKAWYRPIFEQYLKGPEEHA